MSALLEHLQSVSEAWVGAFGSGGWLLLAMASLAGVLGALRIVTVSVMWLMARSERKYQQQVERRRQGLAAASMAPPRASGIKHGRVG